jgi:hypothetical protein
VPSACSSSPPPITARPGPRPRPPSIPLSRRAPSSTSRTNPRPASQYSRRFPDRLAQGVVFIPYRLENLRIVPVGGASARDISPRVGHLHITLDDLPWQWADYGGSNTVILVGLPRGEHKVRIEAVDPEGRPFIERTVTFTVPGPASSSR